MAEELTLSELQIGKSALEHKAHDLRKVLHELRYSGTSGWQVRFAEVQSELIAVVAQIGQFERRIRATVEGGVEVAEEVHDE